MKKHLKQLLAVDAQQSPVGKITHSQIKQSLGFGAIVAPSSLYGHSLASMIHGALPAAVQGLASVDVVSGAAGFAVGSVAALAWKFMRHYE